MFFNNIDWGKILPLSWFGVGVETNTISWGISYKDLIGNNKFTFTVKTDESGTSNNDQFTLPLDSNFGTSVATPAIVEWGDGNTDTISSYNQAEITHTYSSAGTYTIKISDYMRGWKFNNSGDERKMIEISNWGIYVNTEQSAFFDCLNMDVTATDKPTLEAVGSMFRNCHNLVTMQPNDWDVSGLTSFGSMFRGCLKFNSYIGDWDMSNATNLTNMFFNAELFNQNISGWDVSSVTSFGGIFRDAEAFNQPIGAWDTSSATGMKASFQRTRDFQQDLSNWDISSLNSTDDLNDFMKNKTGSNSYSTALYDALLIAWAGQTVRSGLSPNFGGAQFTSGGAAEAARTSLINDDGWTITDGGAA